MTTRARGKQRAQSDGEEDGDNDGVAGVNDPDEDAQGEEEEQEDLTQSDLHQKTDARDS